MPDDTKTFGQKLAESIKPIEDKIASGQAPGDQQVASAAGADKKQQTPATDPDDEIISGKRNPKSDDFKRVKTLAGEFKTKAEQAEAKYNEAIKKLEEAEKQPKHNVELIRKLEEERDKFKGMFETVAVEFSPDFNAKYGNRIASVVEGLKANLPDEAVAAVGQILQLPDSQSKREQLSELLSDMDEVQKTEVIAANREIRAIINERQSAVAKANETLSKLAEERGSKAKARSEAMQKTFEAQLAKSRDEKDGLVVFRKVDGDEDWNKSVSERERVAKAIFEDRFDNDEDRAEAAIWAASAPAFLSELKSKAAKIEELENTLKELQSASPGLGAGQGSGSGGGRKSFSQRISESIGGK